MGRRNLTAVSTTTAEDYNRMRTSCAECWDVIATLAHARMLPPSYYERGERPINPRGAGGLQGRNAISNT